MTIAAPIVIEPPIPKHKPQEHLISSRGSSSSFFFLKFISCVLFRCLQNYRIPWWCQSLMCWFIFIECSKKGNFHGQNIKQWLKLVLNWFSNQQNKAKQKGILRLHGLNWHFSRYPNRFKSTVTTESLWPTTKSLPMRHFMSLYHKGHQK